MAESTVSRPLCEYMNSQAWSQFFLLKFSRAVPLVFSWAPHLFFFFCPVPCDIFSYFFLGLLLCGVFYLFFSVLLLCFLCCLLIFFLDFFSAGFSTYFFLCFYFVSCAVYLFFSWTSSLRGFLLISPVLSTYFFRCPLFLFSRDFSFLFFLTVAL